jgi:protein-disulfide isomerase
VANPRKSAPEASAEETPARPDRTWLYVVATVVLLALAGGIYYYRSNSVPDPNAPKKDPDLAELMNPGPLPDMVLGKADAPNTIIEYASMTCPHCGRFETSVYPEFRTKYVDTGKARIIFREFPLDGLAARASMLIRCAGPDRYFPMIEVLFQTQANWVVEGPQAMDNLLQIARQAGFSKEGFDKCMADKELFQKIVDSRQRAHDVFGVDSTPTFFVNGKRLTGEHELKDFEAMMQGVGPSTTPPAGGTSTPTPPAAPTPPTGQTGTPTPPNG